MEFLKTVTQQQIDKITTLIFDVDGILTDGHIGYGDTGNEIKFFHARDGLAIRFALRGNLKIGILSGRICPANTHRFQELNVTFAYQGSHDKLETFRQLLQEQNLTAEECLYMGDDIVDYPVMRRVGIGVTVPNGDSSLESIADIRTSNIGGNGAAREIIEFILKEQGKWSKVTEKYYL